MWRRWAIITDLIRVGLRRPVSLLRSLKWQHFRTLAYAIGHEPPSLILYNFGQLLSDRKRVTLTHEQRLFEFGGLSLYVEHLLLLPGRVEIKGWVHAPNLDSIRGIQINGDGKKIGILTLHLDRPDLERRYGKDYAKSGFYGFFTVSESVQHWSLTIHKEDNSVLCPLPDYSEESRYTDWSCIDQEFRPSIRQIRRNFKKIPSPNFRIILNMTPAQSERLDLEGLPSLVNEGGIGEECALVIQLSPHCTPQPDLVWQVLYAFENSDRKASLLYWDEDVLRADGQRFSPLFKPQWNLDYLLSWNYIGESFAYFFEGPSPQRTHPLAVLKGQQDVVVHLPMVLSHRVQNAAHSDLGYERNVREQQLGKFFPTGRLENGRLEETFRVRFPVDESLAVTIIVPFRDKPELLRTCLQSVEKTATYQSIRWILVNNQSREEGTRTFLEQLLKERSDDLRIIEYDQEFNFADLHNSVLERVTTPFVLFMNNDITAIEPGWLTAMMEYAQQDRVGAVGAMLLYPDRTIQHAGVLVGIGGAADHAFKYLPDDTPGYGMRAQSVQQLSAVTAACMLMRTDVYRKAGGMDATRFSVAFNDVDLCLKIRNLGYDIVYTPFARLLHNESASRGVDSTPDQRERARREIRAFQDVWRDYLEEGDPFYHGMFSITSGHYLFRG